MTEPTLKIGPSGYKLNPDKLKGASQSILPYVCGAFYYTEDYEYFDVIKPYLDILEPRKSLEQISQELDEKFDKLIEKTHLNFRLSPNWLYKLERYKECCKKQDADFEYARENGFFPPKYTLSGVFDCSTLSVNSQIDISSPSFAIKQSNSHQGYYTIGEDRYYRFYMEKKPNMIFRFFVYKLMGFKWIDEVL
jgi:hypothetical protein